MGDFCPKDADLLYLCPLVVRVRRSAEKPFSALAFRCTLALHASQPALRLTARPINVAMSAAPHERAVLWDVDGTLLSTKLDRCYP